MDSENVFDYSEEDELAESSQAVKTRSKAKSSRVKQKPKVSADWTDDEILKLISCASVNYWNREHSSVQNFYTVETLLLLVHVSDLQNNHYPPDDWPIHEPKLYAFF